MTLTVMWNKPYSFKEGTLIVIGLMVTGALLQVAMGPLNWDIFIWPANILALAAFVSILVAIHLWRRKCYFFRFMTTGKAAVPAIVGALLLTLVMGLTRQVGQTAAPSDPLAFTKMLESWPFILVYVWLTAIVGEETLLQATHPSRRNFLIMTSHLGLFIVLTCGTLGSADMQRLKMYCEVGKPEWRGLDVWNNVHELPVAVQLEKFVIDEYPPKLMIIDDNGKTLPIGKPDIMEVNDNGDKGQLTNWDIRVKRKIDNAMPSTLIKMIGSMPEEMASRLLLDSLGQAANKDGYVSTKLPGAECALYVEARQQQNSVGHHHTAAGWITCGSYQFNYQALRLDDSHQLVMAAREPRRYASNVTVFTKDGNTLKSNIEVNKPLTVNGWKIYQLSYNEQMGKWSTLSIFELVRDPWLPAVYIGILFLAIGAIGIFFMPTKQQS